MLKKFHSYITDHKLFEKDKKVLLGVSGGIDSATMAHLFNDSDFRFGIAHCNFQLRGHESNEDEAFVERLASEFQVAFHSTQFETEKYAEEKKVSIQMAARDLRYNWFDEIRKKYAYDYIAIAHNRDDNVETFFINLSRGTGIRGLTGIKDKSKHTIRPLLFAGRDEIETYCREKNIQFREDSTNKSTKYTRNKLRHDIIPQLETINPRFKQTMVENIERLTNVELIYHSVIDREIKNLISESENTIRINIEKLTAVPYSRALLFEILHPLEFTNQQINDIIHALDGIPGKQFFSHSHRLIKDREALIIDEIKDQDHQKLYIEQDTEETEFPIKLKLSKVNIGDNFNIPRDKNIACFDYDKLYFPLILRHWQQGDYFMPLGMKGLKKVSDFFIDNKFSIAEKEKTWLLESGSKICWILGHRIDERYKITPETKQVLIIEFLG